MPARDARAGSARRVMRCALPFRMPRRFRDRQNYEWNAPESVGTLSFTCGNSHRYGKPLKQRGFLPRSGGHSSSYWCQLGQVPRLGRRCSIRRDRAGHRSRSLSADRAEHPEHRGRALSDRPDLGLCGAELKPASRAVIAPVAPSLAPRAYAWLGLIASISATAPTYPRPRFRAIRLPRQRRATFWAGSHPHR